MKLQCKVKLIITGAQCLFNHSAEYALYIHTTYVLISEILAYIC